MRFSSGQAFRDQPHLAITLFGMSGVGKTTIARRLQAQEWFHFSVDYRIGTRYMGEHIVDNFKREAMKVPFLRQLLRSDSIYIRSNITFENLSPLSTYLGKPGDPARGGIPYAEYCHRQGQHRQAEVAALLDVPEFIARSHDIYGYPHFVCDTGGSLCEVVDPADPADPVLTCLAQHSLMLYLEGTEAHLQTLVDRFRQQPKPMYYPPAFLDATWSVYKDQLGLSDDDAVDPDAFAVWGFEQLLRSRQPRYAAIAKQYGYTIRMDDLAAVSDNAAFLDLVAKTIDVQAHHAR